MEKEITGTINYAIKITDGTIDIDYNTNIDNDLAMICAAQYIMEGCAIAQRDFKSKATGKAKQNIAESLDRILKGRNALNVVINEFINNYEYAKKSQEEHEKKVQFLKDNNITIEKGFISKEEGDKMLGIKPSDSFEGEKNKSTGLTGLDKQNINTSLI